VFFKLFLVVSILCLSSAQLISQDLLAKRIMIYNKIVEPKLEMDSAKLFYNLKFTPEKKESVYRNIEIIQHRKNSTKSTSFFWLLLFLFIFSMVRYASGKKYSDLISDFFSFRIRNLNSFGILKSTLVTIAFIVLLSYTIARLFDEHFKVNAIDRNLIFIIFSIISILVFRLVVYRLVVFIFNLKNNISNFQIVVFDFMYIFVFISLPILFCTTIVVDTLVEPILIILSAVTFLFYLYASYKIIILNIHLLTRHVFKTVIYFYIVEIIPILLFLKYLKLL
jgi:hypothetical protein